MAEFDLQPSRALLYLFLPLYLLVGITIWFARLPWPLQSGLFAVVIITGGLAIRRMVLLRVASSIVRMKQNPDGRWILWRRDGRTLERALVESAGFLSPWLVVLVFAPVPARAPILAHRRIPVMLARDTLSPDLFRRLRVDLGLRRHLV
ncbi:MAG: hypothetical protein J4A00_09755 [Gammaproteobacteria bacterium]|nr:hypothetical protein [Gammaproteobacteria bacterium]